MAIRRYLRRHWTGVTATVIATAAAAVCFAVFWTMPPRTIVMATGTEGDAYYDIGRRYQEILARSGVRVRLVSTNGAVANLSLLRNPRSGVSVALVQGGTTTERESPNLESLGTVFYEPLWLFQRRELGGKGVDELRGRKISIGPEGSGTRLVASELLKRRGIDERTVEFFGYPPQTAGEKLLAGEIDAAIMVVASDSKTVQKLLSDERVELTSFPHIDAYISLYPYLSKVTVPAGVGDLATNRPPADVDLFAAKASLVVRDDVHSAIQFLLLNAAVQIHSRPGILRRPGQFPAAEAIDLPLSDEANQFYKSGRPFLQNYLPFWAASLAGRMLIVLIPIVGILYPLLRLVPAIYGWVMRRRVARLYGELRFLEDELITRREASEARTISERLDNLERQANRLRIPAAYASMVYMLRHHIDLVRQRLMAHPLP